MERRYETLRGMVLSERKIAAAEERERIVSGLERMAERYEERAAELDVERAAVIEGIRTVGLDGVTGGDLKAVIAPELLRDVIEQIGNAPLGRGQ